MFKIPVAFRSLVSYHRAMGIVSLQNVHMNFNGHIVLDSLDWEIQRGEKVGLVGANGSGKTTLFRLVAGEMKPHLGTVTRTRGLEVAVLPQEPRLDSENTLRNEVTTTFAHLQELEQRLVDVSHRISEHHDTDQIDDLMAEYDELQHRLEAAGGYKYEICVNEVLGGLGFSQSDYDLPIRALSGGQKCRAAIAKLLLQEADLLLLDEPTNHLDIEATRFLEKFLAGYHGAAVIISHDRYLLDRVTDKIADLDNKKVTVYPCSYSDYAEAKQIRLMTSERAFEKQQEWIEHQREYAARVKADKKRSKQAHSRLRAVDKLERDGKLISQPTHTKRKMALDFAPARRAGEMVLKCEGLRKAYGDVVLFDDFNLEIYRGEKIGIVGPNGVGKSTLIKMAMGKTPSDSGLIRLFETLAVGYYDQEHAGLNCENRVIDEIQAARTGPQEAEIRNYLAKFLFRGDDVYKRIGDLSGGEQSRVVLARLVRSCPQVLILDEPTNHLDIPSKEVLEDALIAFEGAILLVSHDRYFLDRVVNKLLVLSERGQYELIPGNWSRYEEILTEREAAERAAREAARPAGRPAIRSRKSRTEAGEASADESPYDSWSTQKIEDAIIEREEKLATLEAKFADPAVYRDADRARSLRSDADAVRAELVELNSAWEARIE